MNFSQHAACKCGHKLFDHRTFGTASMHICTAPSLTVWGVLKTCSCNEFRPSFETYYQEIYLPLHSKTGTKAWHLIGLIITFLYVVACILNGFWWGLLAAPFVVYPFAWASHFYIEKNKPAAFRNPLFAKLSDIRMCSDLLRGRLD